MRFEVNEDTLEDCITITDTEDKLKTNFDSEIILYPLEDAQAVVDELNVQCATVKMLIEHLESYEDIEDINYWIKEVRDDF